MQIIISVHNKQNVWVCSIDFSQLYYIAWISWVKSSDSCFLAEWIYTDINPVTLRSPGPRTALCYCPNWYRYINTDYKQTKPRKRADRHHKIEQASMTTDVTYFSNPVSSPVKQYITENVSTDENHNITTEPTVNTSATDSSTFKMDFDYEEEKLQQQLAIEFLNRRIAYATSQAQHIETRCRQAALRRQRCAVRRGQTWPRFLLQLRLSTISGLQVTYKRLLEQLQSERRERMGALVDLQCRYASRLAAEVKLHEAHRSQQIHTTGGVSTRYIRNTEWWKTGRSENGANTWQSIYLFIYPRV